MTLATHAMSDVSDLRAELASGLLLGLRNQRLQSPVLQPAFYPGRLQASGFPHSKSRHGSQNDWKVLTISRSSDY